MRELGQQFGITDTTSVLDIGGGEFNWQFLSVKPRLVFLNLHAPSEANNWVVADGCYLPFRDRSFDVVYSNSVIEHLSNFRNQWQFAAECQRVGNRFYVQTPYKWFFVEPHLITPIIHWLPRPWRRRLLRNFTIWGLFTRPDGPTCERFLDEVRLLDMTELQALFPKAVIWREKFLGLTKSLIVVDDIQDDARRC